MSFVPLPEYLYYFCGMSMLLCASLYKLVPRELRYKNGLNWYFLATGLLGLEQILFALFVENDINRQLLFVAVIFCGFISLHELLRVNLSGFFHSTAGYFIYHLVELLTILWLYNYGYQYLQIYRDCLLIICAALLLIKVSSDSKIVYRCFVGCTLVIALSSLTNILYLFSEKTALETLFSDCHMIIARTPIVTQLFLSLIVSAILLTGRLLRDRQEGPFSGNFAGIISPILIFIILLVINIAGSTTAHHLMRKNFLQLEANINKSTDALIRIFQQRILVANTSSRLMSVSPIVVDFINNPTSANTELMNIVLESFAANYPDGLCFVTDNEGNIIASSQFFERLKMRTVAFRSYFTSSIAGKTGQMIDFGHYLEDLGYYSSYPVYDEKTSKIIGVCIVKRNLTDLQEYFALYNPAMLVNQDMKVVLASDDFALGKQLVLGKEKPQVDLKEQLLFSKCDYLMQKVDIGIEGWSLVLFKSSKEARQVAKDTMVVLMLVSLIFIAIMAGQLKNTHTIRMLKVTREQFETVFYSAPESIFVVGCKKLDILTANSSMSEKFGFLQTPVGQNYKSLIASGSNRLKNVSHNFKTGSFMHERDFKKTNGDVFTAAVIGRKINFDGKKAILFLLHDISERRLTELKLLQAKAAAEQANQLKSRFLANTGHEIRTPMTAIIGLTELVRSKSADDEQKRIIDLIRSASQDLLELVTDVLDLSSIQSGRLKIRENIFNPALMAEELMQMVSLRVEPKLVSTNLNVDSSLCNAVLADEQKIRQVLLNLLTNSIKHTESGYIKMNINFYKNDANSAQLEYQISDTGSGISEQMRKNLFKPFNYDHRHGSGKDRSAGLGLAISKEMLQLIGGKIDLESKLGKGTTFTVTIPVKIADTKLLPDKEKININRAVRYDLNIDNKPLRFLVVDDNEANVFLARTIIEDCNGICVSASNGLEAIEILKNNTFDLLMLDIQMPELDGIETLKRMKSEIDDKTPVIAVSAFTEDSEKKKAFDAGANYYLTKPYFPVDFFNAVKAALKITDLVKLENNQEFKQLKDDKEKIINVADLKIRVLHKPENIYQISEIFNRRSHNLIQGLLSSVTENDFKKVSEVAHSLKGLTGMLSAHKAFKKSEELENASKNQNGELVKSLSEDLISYMNAIKKELDELAKNIN